VIASFLRISFWLRLRAKMIEKMLILLSWYLKDCSLIFEDGGVVESIDEKGISLKNFANL